MKWLNELERAAMLGMLGFMAWRLARFMQATDAAAAASSEQMQRLVDAALLARREGEF